jgi:hypothetical protein
MSKKDQQPRNKLGRFAKTNPAPSLLATLVPRKSSQPAQPSSSFIDELSSPDLSGILELPGSFPSSAAASPVCPTHTHPTVHNRSTQTPSNDTPAHPHKRIVHSSIAPAHPNAINVHSDDPHPASLYTFCVHTDYALSLCLACTL